MMTDVDVECLLILTRLVQWARIVEELMLFGKRCRWLCDVRIEQWRLARRRNKSLVEVEFVLLLRMLLGREIVIRHLKMV